ncbi:MAG: hypothetical protein ACR2KB_10540 [Chitinophagaceae bacterium]
MRKYIACTALLLLSFSLSAQTLTEKIDEVQFFADQSMLEVNIMMDLKNMMVNKLKEGQKFTANFTAKFEDGSEITGPVTLEVRGKYRRENCYLPPLKINFKNEKSPILTPLGSIKLVNVCEVGRRNNADYVLKEYLTYKIFNLFTDKSLRARLLKINYIDSFGKRKPIQEFGFLLEDVSDMARRNDCIERKTPVKHTEQTDRKHMTKVAMFEYMIGNTDWSVPARHNIKLVVPKEDTSAIPFPVPYDFDHSGLVKTDYALPPPQLSITDVTQRSYRGFARNLEEINTMVEEFIIKKEAIYNLVQNFEYISDNAKKNMISFLNEFYVTLSRPKSVNAEFIQNARKD